MASSTRSLVMGVATGYKASLLLPFVRSLRKSGYRERICFFLCGLDETSAGEIWREVDDVVSLDNVYAPPPVQAAAVRMALGLSRRVRNAARLSRLYPVFFRTPLLTCPRARRRRLYAQMEQALEGLQSLRYAHYLAYLREQAEPSDFVMLSDLRDVLFQADPFDHDVAELEVFLEADHVHIGSQALNRRWIADLYGERTARALADCPVSCSGTVIGMRDGILRYLEAMAGEIDCKLRRPLGSHDQGIHNYLLQTGRLDPAHVYSNGCGPVATIGMERDVRFDDRLGVLNSDGSVPAVVHQYDRHPGIAGRLLERWAGS